ncbi:hypothetical protein [Bowmanella sp. JS7-9]|uniref:Uncharacterized protein n=1 Tax=Pseudobowmanella zhangzhouensis TaxID=1537679 RepID=A0ABW1XKX6_9ALTE|nr:hypothetical protein [Bowmanella sp. JS7-9]TBX25799.1 hypothetical protein TK45_03725 [Bowmanella sp. JS7-9]
MKKDIATFLAILLIAVLYTQFNEISYKLGFAELKMSAILENSEKMKVKCDAYAYGYFDEIKIQNKFQKCINDYEKEGYTLVSRVDA